MRHLIPISGKDSMATAIVQMARAPELSYEFVFNDTRMELPETYAWLDRAQAYLGQPIIRAGKSLETVIEEQRILPSPRARYCTKYAKIFPMRDFIGKDEATLYLGIRADEDRAGGQETRNMKVSYPLKELGINLAMVYRLLTDRDLLPPSFFWRRLHDAVLHELGDDSYLIDAVPAWVFARTFAWRSRPNCYMCFYQRLYEFLGLLEHHPDLFERAEAIESSFGSSESTRKHAFCWLGEGKPLRHVRDNAEAIFSKRVDAITTALLERRQRELFTDAAVDDLEKAQTSCGLYCGK